MKTILVIEDQVDMLSNLLTILQMENYVVLTASNGREGIRLAVLEKPDLILCDVMMPEMNGFQVLDALRSDRTVAATPFIFLTAKGDVHHVRSGMNLGADDYLTKPVTATDLLAAVSARLRRAELTRSGAFAPDFSDPAPLESLGLTRREAEVLLWVAQGKSNSEISAIIGAAENTIKKHMQHIFEKLGVESRAGATLRALQNLSTARDG